MRTCPVGDKTSWALASALLAGVMAAGSREARPAAVLRPEANVAAAMGAPSSSVPFDVQAVMRRVHFAFRAEGGRFTGGHSTYAVEAEAGKLSVKPVHYVHAPEPEPRTPGDPGRPTGPTRPAPPVVGAPLVVETSSIRRGSHGIRPTDPSAVDENGRLVRGGAAVREIVENKGEGVELSWSFPTHPEGEGDLEVRVAASGQDYAGETASGLHFRDAASRLGIRFGHATWIGADGRRAEVRARWDGREIVMAVPAGVVDGAAYPAVLDPIIGPETALDAPVTGTATGGQYSTSTAYDPGSSVYLVVWSDYRASTTSQVFATRVSSAGAVLDPNGIQVSNLPNYTGQASVVFDGTNFLVVFDQSCDIWGRRIAATGTFVDASPFAINNHSSCSFFPFASSDGTTALVAWVDYRNNATTGADIFGARVLGSTILDGVGTGIAISTAAATQYQPRIAYGAGNWLVVWYDYRNQATTGSDIYGTRVSGAGTVLDGAATGIAISTAAAEQYYPWPASNGTDYFVTWQDTRNQATTGYDIYGARITSAGVVTDAAGIQICNNAAYQYYSSVAFGGGNYQVVWQDSRGAGLFGNRVVPGTGALLDGAGGAAIPGIPVFVYEPRIVAAGTGFYVAWFVYPVDVDANVQGSRLTTTPSLLDAPGVNLANSANGQLYAAVAGDTSNYLVVWQDDRGGSRSIFGARVNGTTGVSMDPAGILLSAGSQSESYPAVAFNGSQYLVVWQGYSPTYGIWGTRVSTGGAVVDSPALGLFLNSAGNQPNNPSVASDGANWFVTWHDSRNYAATAYDIFGGRVNGGTGAPMDPAGILISNAPNQQYYPRVAFGGGNYLVVWYDYRPGTNSDLYGARVNTSGVVQEPTATNIPIRTGPGYVGVYSSLAYANPNFLVAYDEGATVRRARVASSTGAVVDDLALTGCCNYQPSVAYDADTFLVLYRIYTAFGFDIKGTRVDTAGVDIDPVDWSVSTGGGITYYGGDIAALTGSAGRAIFAYSRYDSTPGITADRVRIRLITRALSDLAVTKTDGQATEVPGTTVTYTMTVSNGGPQVANGTAVTDTVPSSLSSVTWTCTPAGGATCPASGSGSINHTVNLPVGGSVTYSLTGTISASATGSLANTITATVPSGFSDPNTANNSATDTDTLSPQADLAITKTDGRTTTSPGAAVTYTIVASNLGPSVVTGATVTDALPSTITGATWTCTPTGGGSCAASGSGSISQSVDLPVGATVTFSVNGTVSASATGTLSNTATVTVPSGTSDPTSSNNSATDVDTIIPVNNGPSTAKDVLIGSTSSDSLGPAPNDQNWFRYRVQADRSYCVEVDNGKGDTSVRDTIVAVYRADGTTLLDLNDDIADEPGGPLLSRACYIATVTEDNLARVTAGASGTPGGFRVRVLETTLFCPWLGPLFAGSGFESFILMKNTTGTAFNATVTLTGAGGTTLGSPQSGNVPADGSYNLQVSAPPPTGFGLSGVSGGVFIAHEGPPGGLIANVTTLNFGSGVSYDTPAVPRQDYRQ